MLILRQNSKSQTDNPVMRRTPGTNLRNAIITAAWQLARSAHSTVERRRGSITSLPLNVDVYKNTVAIRLGHQ